MFVLLQTLIIISVAIFTIWYNVHKRKFKSLKVIPELNAYPVLGSVLEFGFNPVDQLRNLSKFSKIYKPYFKMWVGPKNIYIITTDPELTEFILSSPKYIKKSDDYNIFRPWLQNGLLLSTGTAWQKRRKILTPAFHFKILESFIDIINTQTNIFVKRLTEKVDKGTFDVYPYVTACTLDVICESAMGASVNAQSTINNEYVAAVKTVCCVIMERVFSSWKQFDLLFPLSNAFKKQQQALHIIHSFTKSVIEQRRIKIQNTDNKEISNDDIGIKKKQVFLDILLNASIDGKPLTDKEIQEEVDTFMFEGHDTTASLIAFAMYELGKNPHVQNKLYAELKEICGNDKNFQPTHQSLSEMKYTELVLKEAMRLYPSVPFYARSLEETVHFKNIIIPKDTIISLFIFGMQRREDLYSNAEQFEPERFLSNNFLSNPFAYVPFSAGPRNCIGQKFAMIEAKISLAKIIMNFEILPVESKYDPVLSSEIILKSHNGVHIQLRNR